jgi:hypothetical protein
MIWSVSILSIGIGIMRLVRVVNLAMVMLPLA